MGNVANNGIISSQSVGNRHQAIANVKGSTSYATGGDTLLASDFGMKWIEFAEVSGTDDNSYVVTPIFSGTKPVASIKLLFLTPTTPAQPSSTTDLSSKKFRVRLFGY